MKLTTEAAIALGTEEGLLGADYKIWLHMVGRSISAMELSKELKMKDANVYKSTTRLRNAGWIEIVEVVGNTKKYTATIPQNKINKKKEAATMLKLKYNPENDRMGIYDEDNEEWINYGLHCGECLDVCINDTWIPTRIEYSSNQEWYLVGMRLVGAHQLENLKCRQR